MTKSVQIKFTVFNNDSHEYGRASYCDVPDNWKGLKSTIDFAIKIIVLLLRWSYKNDGYE